MTTKKQVRVPKTMDLPRSKTREELYAALLEQLGQAILPDSEMRAAGYSETAISDMSRLPARRGKGRK